MRQSIKTGALLLGILMMVLLTGCGEVKEAEAAFGTMMEAMQSGDRDRIASYDRLEEGSRFLYDEDRNALDEAVLQTLGNMEWRVVSTEKLDGANVKICAEVTTLDFSVVMDRYTEAMMQMVGDVDYQNAVATMKQEEYQRRLAEKMTEVLADDTLPTCTQTAELTMAKTEDGWVVGTNRGAWFGMLYRDLLDAVNALA